MNRTLKRVLGLTGSVVVGLAGAVTFASAAQAHHPEVSGTADCVDGNWEVTWTATLIAPPGDDVPDGVITAINPTEPAIDGDLQVGATGPHGAAFTGVQTFPGDTTEASLTVAAEWDYEGDQHDVKDERTGTVEFKGTCEADEEPEPEVPETSVGYSSDCFAITITASNSNPEALAEFTFTPSEGEPVTGKPEVEEPLVHTFLVVDPDSEFSVTVTAGEEELGVFDWEGPADCPVFDVAESCEGLTFDVEVPAEGTETTFTVVTSEGDEYSLTVAPGESDTIEVPVEADSITIDWSYTDGKFIQPGTFDWEKPVCDEETTPAADEQLPTTGSSQTIMISAAAALVVAAAVLFVVARRRRAVQDW
ncbi:LPXTG cell wall anchor domain-containing protein [Glycomyces salinus]|uniref:LPXTG cell wall anchor domain-containing protein n=1 Tax=Glycomyces salinus TaxID=980294 RepID=UPI0018ED71C7|nr:LPXTG cell wall anchor domain-containing protein [Glycomyces salinus]